MLKRFPQVKKTAKFKNFNLNFYSFDLEQNETITKWFRSKLVESWRDLENIEDIHNAGVVKNAIGTV